MTTIDRTTVSDARFRESCRTAFRSELLVAYTCVQLGAVQVVMPDYHVRAKFEDRAQFRDAGDLRVRWNHGARQQFYEVKNPDVRFTSPRDHPFPRTVFVDEVANLTAKDPRPDGYFICNADLTVALFVDLHHWQPDDLQIVSKFDSRYGQQIDYYAVRADQTRCVALRQVAPEVNA